MFCPITERRPCQDETASIPGTVGIGPAAAALFNAVKHRDVPTAELMDYLLLIANIQATMALSARARYLTLAA
jgi:hypothetical protein